jgi:hypothetical protein
MDEIWVHLDSKALNSFDADRCCLHRYASMPLMSANQVGDRLNENIQHFDQFETKTDLTTVDMQMFVAAFDIIAAENRDDMVVDNLNNLIVDKSNRLPLPVTFGFCCCCC